MAEGIWNLYAKADDLDAASESWSKVSSSLEAAGDGVDARARSVRDAGWEGETADSFDGHRKKLVADLDRCSTVAGTIAATLARSAGTVRVAQGQLDLSWATVLGVDHTGSPTGDVRFDPKDERELKLVEAAIRRASDVRSDLDGKLAADSKALDHATTEWRKITATWAAVAGGADAFDVPDGPEGTGVITDGDTTIVNTGSGDDVVDVFIDPMTGEQIVVVNGTVYRLPADQRIVIRGGAGNDRIGVPKGTRVDVTILGGEGDDDIQGGDGNDAIYGLDGHDYIDAGAGDDRAAGGADRDYVNGQSGDDDVSGGEGDDTVYAGDGNDVVSGDNGNDYLEGGAGDDDVYGGAGDDTVSGGTGDDDLRGGGGDDVAYAGKGADTTDGGSGNDTSYSESGDTDTGSERVVAVQIKGVPDFIKVDGSPEFQERVREDLELLASSPRGQQMLADFQHTYDDSGFLGFGKKGLTISEYPDNTNSTAEPSGEHINYSTRLDTIENGPPLVVLFHEMAHEYDFRHDQFDSDLYNGDDPVDHGYRNGERTAVGLPIDDDDDPSTPERLQPNHPYDLTENGLREELGAPRRPHY